VRVINCARGGLIDERALLEAIKEGRVAGAALDVFEQEPPDADHPLLRLEEVIVTPHLGASTFEAQEGVALTVAEQMRDYFLTGALRGPSTCLRWALRDMQVLRPYIDLAGRLGRLQAQLAGEPVREVSVEYAGEAAELDGAPVTRAFLAGLLRNVSARANLVNAFLIAEERGITVTTSYKRGSTGEMRPPVHTRVVTSGGEHAAAGALFGPQGEGRITQLDGFVVEAVPSGHMVVTRSDDVPGVIGRVGTALGNRGVNISRFHLGRRERGGEAIAVIETDAPVDDATIDELLSNGDVISARRIELD
jgi:D-3-phosphoglycerate dehydrogenase